MSRASYDAANQTAMTDLAASLAPMCHVNGWRRTLAFYAERGYPTGSDSTGTTNSVNRPTERIALAGLEEPAAKLKRADELARIIQQAARELNSIRLWTITPAVYRDPEPIPCRNLNCPNVMERHKGESPRDGRCPRCATHHRRYHLEWPAKYVTAAEHVKQLRQGN